MLCTRCSEPIRPIVALDIDGTLGDYHGHFLRFAMNYLGESLATIPANYKPYDGVLPFKSWFCETFNVTYDTWHDIKLAYRQGGMKRTMPLYTYAPQLAAGLVSEGAEVWLTTTRPYLRLDSVDPDTREWLRRHEIEYHHLLYDDDKYTKLEQRIDAARVVAVLDDLLEDWVAARDEFGPDVPVFRRNGYNEGVKLPDGAVEVAHLHEAHSLIIGRVRNFNMATSRR